MKVYGLILEVTRRCNMNCAHCLRGEQEDVDMSMETMKKAFDLFDEVCEITFTGGEPSLNVPLINAAIDLMQKKNMSPSSFFIATNGKENVDELLAASDRLYYMCQETTSTKPVGYDAISHMYDYLKEEYMGSIALSCDNYHEPIPLGNVIKLMSRSYFSAAKIQKFDNEHKVIDRGRAYGLDAPKRVPYPMAFSGEDDMFEQIYVNVHGDILADCDQDYDNQRFESCGNVYDGDITSVLQDLLENENK